MTEENTLKAAYLAVMSDIDNIVHRALNKIGAELKNENELEAYQSVLDTASLGNALIALRVVYRAKFKHEEVEKET